MKIKKTIWRRNLYTNIQKKSITSYILYNQKKVNANMQTINEHLLL